MSDTLPDPDLIAALPFPGRPALYVSVPLPG
jgi:hypothetical protein